VEVEVEEVVGWELKFFSVLKLALLDFLEF
jgi:hypothetical protein